MASPPPHGLPSPPPALKLDQLPVEILTQIFKLFPKHPRALAQLCKVCMTFRYVATELLYCDITIPTVYETTIDPLLIKCLLYVENFGITYIRNITVRGNIRSDLKKFDEDARRNEPERRDGCSPTIMNMALMLCMVLDKIPKGQLESFIWDVDAFFSWTLTDKLQERHPRLKVLQLRDGDDGPWDRPWLEDMKFSNLRSLDWGNITTHEVLVSLSTLISSNALTLKSLSVSLRSFNELKEDYWGYLEGMGGDSFDEDLLANFLPEELFKKLLEAPSRTDNQQAGGPVQVRRYKKRQLYLERLLLEKCPFDDSAHELLGSCIDLSSLQTLTLRRCPDTDQLLQSWIASADTIRLKSLELLLEYGSGGIVPFLVAFTGLKNLYILLENLENILRMDAIFESIYHHEETLRRLVIDVKRRGKAIGISTANIMGIRKRLKIWELGIALRPEEGVRGELRSRAAPSWADEIYGGQISDSGIEFLCTSYNNKINAAGTISTIHIRNLRRPACKTYDDPFVGTKNFFRSKTFRHRKADAETMIRPLDFGRGNGKPGSLEAIIIGPVDENKAYENLGAATEFSCFLVDYVKTRVGMGLPILNPVSMGDLKYFEVPCEVTNVRW